jgi:alpha-N-arabinofuranosidase
MNCLARFGHSIHRFFPGMLCLAATVSAQSTLSLNVGQATYTINKEIYGGLLENTSRDIYGGIYVGTASAIPNTNGMRNDVIAAFKEAGVTILDWPGGCFAELYNWRDGIGPKASRPSGDMVNGMGTAEYFQLCDSLKAVPYITANINNQTPAVMTAWLNYIDSLFPNKLKYWKMGNEPWGGCSGLGVPTLSITQYIAKYNSYKVAIPADLQGKILRMADGGSGDYLGRPAWIDSLMLCEMGSMEGATFHYYGGFSGAATGFPEADYYSRLASQWLLNDKLKAWDSIMTRRDPNYTVPLMVDEWGLWYSNPNQSTCRDAIGASMTFNMFNNRCRRIKMAGVAQPVNFIQPLVLTRDPPTTSMVKTPTLYVFKMYKVHQQAKMVPATLTTTNNQNVPIITASSSVDSTGKLHISMCNTHASSTHTVAISLNSAPAYTTCTGTIINGPAYNSYNAFDVAEIVTAQNFTGATMNGTTVNVTMPAHSVVTLELTPGVGVFKQPADGMSSPYKIGRAAKGQIVVTYAVTERTPFTLGLYTVDGRAVVETFKGTLEPGRKTVVWQPRNLGKGTKVYIVKMNFDGGAKSQRVYFSDKR